MRNAVLEGRYLRLMSVVILTNHVLSTYISPLITVEPIACIVVIPYLYHLHRYECISPELEHETTHRVIDSTFV